MQEDLQTALLLLDILVHCLAAEAHFLVVGVSFCVDLAW